MSAPAPSTVPPTPIRRTSRRLIPCRCIVVSEVIAIDLPRSCRPLAVSVRWAIRKAIATCSQPGRAEYHCRGGSQLELGVAAGLQGEACVTKRLRTCGSGYSARSTSRLRARGGLGGACWRLVRGHQPMIGSDEIRRRGTSGRRDDATGRPATPATFRSPVLNCPHGTAQGSTTISGGDRPDCCPRAPCPPGWLLASAPATARHTRHAWRARHASTPPIWVANELRTTRGTLLPDLLITGPPGGSRMGTAMSVTATAAPQRHNPVERYRSRGRGIRGPARRPLAGKASRHG